jgi:uncharacterized alkaline shock family protein YloU
MNADRLPCGAAVDDLVSQVAEGAASARTPHQETCPHCQAALAEYGRLWSPIGELAAEAVHPPQSIIDEVLSRIRHTVSDPAYGVLPGPRGQTRIASRAIAVTARVTTEHVPGVRAALARSGTAADDGAGGVVAGVAGGSTALRITLAAHYGEDLTALADRIRTAVARSIRHITGLQPVEITVIIDDVLEPTSPIEHER